MSHLIQQIIAKSKCEMLPQMKHANFRVKLKKTNTFKRIPQIRYYQWKMCPCLRFSPKRTSLSSLADRNITIPFLPWRKEKAENQHAGCCSHLAAMFDEHRTIAISPWANSIWKKCRKSAEITTPLTHWGSSILRRDRWKNPTWICSSSPSPSPEKVCKSWKISSGCRLSGCWMQ